MKFGGAAPAAHGRIVSMNKRAHEWREDQLREGRTGLGGLVHRRRDRIVGQLLQIVDLSARQRLTHTATLNMLASPRLHSDITACLARLRPGCCSRPPAPSPSVGSA